MEDTGSWHGELIVEMDSDNQAAYMEPQLSWTNMIMNKYKYVMVFSNFYLRTTTFKSTNKYSYVMVISKFYLRAPLKSTARKTPGRPG